MGCRSITTIREKSGDEFYYNAYIYRHWDGNIDGHGRWLYQQLKELTICNGMPLSAGKNFVNGVDRLAGLIIAKMYNDGQEPGVMAAYGPYGQEYEYVITVIDYQRIEIDVYDGPMTMFGLGGEQCENLVFARSIEQFGDFLDTYKRSDGE